METPSLPRAVRQEGPGNRLTQDLRPAPGRGLHQSDALVPLSSHHCPQLCGHRSEALPLKRALLAREMSLPGRRAS